MSDAIMQKFIAEHVRGVADVEALRDALFDIVKAGKEMAFLRGLIANPGADVVAHSIVTAALMFYETVLRRHVALQERN